jgi:hypothetical protein
LGGTQLSELAPVKATHNSAKLLDLRARHDRLHDEFRAASERARAAQAEAGRLRVELTADADNAAAQLLALPPNELAAVPHDQLKAACLDAWTVRRVLEAAKHADTLRDAAAALAARLAPSRALIERMNAYAARYTT